VVRYASNAGVSYVTLDNLTAAMPIGSYRLRADSGALYVQNNTPITSNPLAGSTIMRMVGNTTTQLALNNTAQNYALPVALQENDRLEIVHQFNGSVNERSTHVVWVVPSSTMRFIPWDSTFRVGVVFPATLTATIQVWQEGLTAGTTGRIMQVRIYRPATY
jgi:hypothetical protein